MEGADQIAVSALLSASGSKLTDRIHQSVQPGKMRSIELFPRLPTDGCPLRSIADMWPLCDSRAGDKP